MSDRPYNMTRWRYWLYIRDDKKWQRQFDKIECTYLKSKVAAIVFWDSVTERGLEINPNPRTFLRSLASKWKPWHEGHYTEYEVFCGLVAVGYTKKDAFIRSRKPKTWRSY